MKYNPILSILLIVALCSCTEEVLFDFEENLARELEEINGFIARHNFQVQVDESDIRYQVSQEGVGNRIEIGDTVFFNFQIYLLDSTLIDTNIEEVRMANNLPPGNNMPIRDVVYDFSDMSKLGFFNHVYKLGRQESKFHMLVPSYQAYGATGLTVDQTRTIPPNTPLLAEVEIVEVRPGD